MTITTKPQYDWKDEQTIKQQEFADGYHVERDKRTPDSASEDTLEHNHNEGNPNETTLYADRKTENYNPNTRLPDCEPWPTKGAKFGSLWARNAGVDSHRASRRSREDCHKVDEKAKDRRRFTHAVANDLGLSEGATERATELATVPTPKTLNFCGGLDAWILAVVVHAANEHHDIARLDSDALHDTREDWGVSTDQLATATDMVAEQVEGA